MIVLFTDFGPCGPYTGQMQSILQQRAPGIPVISLLNNAPIGNPRLSAYLLAALRWQFPAGSIFLAIVDPGVGGSRKPIVLQAGQQTFVGPDNGLFHTIALHAEQTAWWEIVWRPAECSMSFHGRDLFAPIAAALATQSADGMLERLAQPELRDWPEDLEEIIYFDHYGNAYTGIRYDAQFNGRVLMVNGQPVSQAQTFSSVKPGQAFWYRNSCGLVEIAVNQGSAQQTRSLALSMPAGFV